MEYSPHLGRGCALGPPTLSPLAQSLRISQIFGEKAACSWACGDFFEPLGVHKKEQQLGRFFWDST